MSENREMDQIIPLVSICCITYNHENYIKDAIESFLIQKTNFPIEIIIHDDASTDRTAEIIREYEQKYPSIIKPIYQSVNQYTKGIRPSLIAYKKARGKYIALCEGDDYWICPNKIQKQVDLLENNNYSMTIHATKVIYSYKHKDSVMRPHNKNKIFKAEEIISRGGGVGQTSSVMFRKEIIEDLPNFFLNAPVEDKYLRMLCATKGNTYYINEVMSVYRKGVPGSWTNNVENNNKRLTKHIQETISTLEEFNIFTQYRFNSDIKTNISRQARRILMNSERRKYISILEVINFKKKLKIIDAVILRLYLSMPFIIPLLKTVRNRRTIHYGD